MLASFLHSLAFGISIFAAALFSTRENHARVYFPLSIFFAANALTYMSTLAASYDLDPIWLSRFRAVDFAPAFLLAPALWFYTKSLTMADEDSEDSRLSIHIMPFLMSCVLALILLSLPLNERVAIFDENKTVEGQAYILRIALSLLIAALALQTILYVSAIIRRLVQYRSRLKNMFASTERRELNWIIWLSVLFAAQLVSVSSFLVLHADDSVQPAAWIWNDLLDLALIFWLALWGARQKPGLSESGGGKPLDWRFEFRLEPPRRHSVPDTLPKEAHEPAPSPKYGRSALTTEMREEIAAKVEHAMQHEKLFLDPNFSLSKLAQKIRTPANYVSQTLNAHMEKSFFDYVNSWRVREALPRIAAREETVLAVAYDVGFNSRSSFYKAFKLETGVTPTQYRDQRSADD